MFLRKKKDEAPIPWCKLAYNTIGNVTGDVFLLLKINLGTNRHAHYLDCAIRYEHLLCCGAALWQQLQLSRQISFPRDWKQFCLLWSNERTFSLRKKGSVCAFLNIVLILLCTDICWSERNKAAQAKQHPACWCCEEYLWIIISSEDMMYLNKTHDVILL